MSSSDIERLTEPTKILSRESSARGYAHIERTKFRRRRFDGEMSEFERETVDTGDGVTILPYDPDRKTIILTRQFRAVAFLKEEREGLIEACAGKLEGADPVTRVIEETWEETGIRLSSAPKQLFTTYSTPGAFAERLTYFVAPYSAKDRVSEGGGLKDENEDIEVIETSLDEALAMIGRGEIIDSKTIVLLYYAKLNGLVA